MKNKTILIKNLHNVVATLEVKFKHKPEGVALSISGSIKTNRTDLGGGQCYDEILRYFPNNSQVNRIVEIWKQYHLNDMHPECPHQKGPAWELKDIEVITWKTTTEVWQKQNAIKDKVVHQVAAKGTAEITAEEQFILNLKYEIIWPTIEENLVQYYTKTSKIEKSNWVYSHNHPEGFLSKPCPACGYKYGHSWNFEAIPEYILKEIEEWPEVIIVSD